jgi:hypothetical protein
MSLGVAGFVALSSKTTLFSGEGIHERKRFPTGSQRKAKLAGRRKRIKKTGNRQLEDLNRNGATAQRAQRAQRG